VLEHKGEKRREGLAKTGRESGGEVSFQSYSAKKSGEMLEGWTTTIVYLLLLREKGVKETREIGSRESGPRIISRKNKDLGK